MTGKSAKLRMVSGAARRREEREFLPAALEILETPPSPAGRALAYILCLIAAVGIGWAWFGKVDIVAVASGNIVAQRRTKLVQPCETSTVLAILVRPGQKVRAGEALIELDATAAIAERDRAGSDLRA